MKNIFGKMGKFSVKGFAVAVCACIAVVGAVGVYSYTKLTKQLNNSLISNDNAKPAETAARSELPADVEQTGVAKTDEPQGENPSAGAVTEMPKNPAEAVLTERENARETQADSADVSADVAEQMKTEARQVMVRPINGEVLNAFSGGELVKSKTLNVWKTHDGVDIAGDMGEKVKSMTSGTVIAVTEDPSMGVTVVIDHGGGIEGHYSNLDKDVRVSVGDEVSAGTVIGEIGDTAGSEISEEPHLHFAVRKNGEWIDPISFISGEGS